MTLGEAAKYRLLSLLNEGPFGLKAGLRDEDKYGRKLRAVYRGSLSLGDVLVKEGFTTRGQGSACLGAETGQQCLPNGDKKADFAIHLDDAVTLQKGYFLL